jgi:hypothetical protein
MGAAKDKAIFGEPFQWHLWTSAHDVTPCCNVGAANLGSTTRICKACQQVYRLPVKVGDWLPLARKLGAARQLVSELEAEMHLLVKGPEPEPEICSACGRPADGIHELVTEGHP